jgi:hypothetical protein
MNIVRSISVEARGHERKTIRGRMHDALVSSRTKLINNLRGWGREVRAC